MEDNSGTELVASLRKNATRFGVVFVHCGAAHRPLFEDLMGAGDHKMNVRDILDGEDIPAGIIVIDGMESLASSDRQDMPRLRQIVHDAADSGSAIILISRYPKIRYEQVPGSTLLLDARKFTLPLGVFLPSVDDSSGVWPACQGGAASAREVSQAIFTELGLEIAATLDCTIFESFLDRAEMISLLREKEIEALEGGGLIQRVDRQYQWAIPNRFGEIRDALADTLAGAIDPQRELAALFSELWSLERMIRNSIRRALLEAHGGKWARKGLHGNLPDLVLTRAKEDVYPGAKSLGEIRDPLEWLTLGELLEVRKSSGVGELGVESVVWDKFHREVGPVRNRVSHMRLIRPGDLDQVRKWRANLMRKLDPQSH